MVLLIGGIIFYNSTFKSRSGNKKAGEAAKSGGNAEEGAAQGVRILLLSIRRITLTFNGIEFSFNPVLPVIGGLVIASISSFIGVGGGFLYVPFLTTIVGLPMVVVAGTSALAVLLSMMTSIFSYVVIKGTFISWWLIGTEMVGVFVGAMIGPRTQKYPGNMAETFVCGSCRLCRTPIFQQRFFRTELAAAFLTFCSSKKWPQLAKTPIEN